MATNLADQYMFVCWVHVKEASGNVYSFVHDPLDSKSIEIHFDVNFSDDDTPPTNTVDFFNLNNDGLNILRVGATISIECGYRSPAGHLDVGVVSSGKINHVYARTGDLGSQGDIQTSISFIEGTDYSKNKFQPVTTGKKGKKMQTTFGNNTRASAILRRISQMSGVPVSVQKLKYDHLYNKGFTIDGDDVLSVVSGIADTCQSKLYYVRGTLVINDIKASKYDGMWISPQTGMIGYPAQTSQDDQTTYSLSCMLQYRLTVGICVLIGSPYVNGYYHIKNGSHSFDGSAATTTLEVI